MKKLLRIISTVFLMSILMCSSAFAETVVENKVEVSYNTETQKLSVDIDLAKSKSKVIGVYIFPDDIVNHLPETIIAEPNTIFKTYQTDLNGVAYFNIDMTNVDAGRYTVKIDFGDMVKELYFVNITDEQCASLYNKFVVDSDYSATVPDVVNPSTSIDDAEIITKFIASNISGITDYDSALKTYVFGEAISYVMNNKLTMDEVFEHYGMYIERQYADRFYALSDNTQSKVSELLVSNGCNEIFSDVFTESVYIASYVTAATEYDIEKLVLEEIPVLNAQLTQEYNALVRKYNSINNDFYMNKVFEQMYLDRGLINDYESLLKNFDDEIKVQLSALSDLKPSKPSGGSPSSSNKSTHLATVVDSNKQTVTDESKNEKLFSDCVGHWAAEYIVDMTARNIFSGYSDGTFKPDQNLTRAEMAKVVASMLNLKSSGTASFDDVSSAEWHSGYISAVAESGIVVGSNGKFMPNEYITRQDAAVILARVLEFKGKTLKVDDFGFNDNDNISEYALDSVNGLANFGIINGYEGNFSPKSNITRAEISTMLAKVLKTIE